MFNVIPGRRARSSAITAAAALCCAAAASSALAQAVASAGTVVVTASRSPQQLSRVLADVSVLERDAIARSGASCAVDLLVGLPGIEFARNGGPAGITSVFVRGAEARHTAVFIDGLRVDDQATGGARWEMLPVDQIERVEVLRGPAAAIYGSDAISGVVQLFTRRSGGATQASAALSAGTHDSVLGRAALSGVVGGLDYALSASHARSRGYNARDTASSNPDRDGWVRSGVQASLGAALAAGHRLDLAMLASNLWGQYDQSRTADDVSRQTLRTANLSWQGRWSDRHDSRVQLGESRNTYESKPSYYRTETTLRNFSWQQGLRIGGHYLTWLAERKEDALRNPATPYAATLEGRRHQDALALGWQADFGDHALQIHLRHDHDSAFGNQPSGSLAWGWQFLPAWRATASVATAFRAPTLYQRFSDYGVASLTPEKARNVELGLRWADGGAEFSATAWQNRLRDLIGFGDPGPCASSFGCYENVNRARYLGLTLAGRGRVAGVALNGSLDWHDPRNLDTDKLLVRRARVLAKLSADTSWAGWGLGLEWQAAGARYDNAANTQRMGGYGVVNLRAARALAPGWTLEARIDNVGDKDYQLARSYPTGGRMAQLGLRWQLL
jgi:vitamin B12 transporter